MSPKGAVGEMQTMPGTLEKPGFGVKPAKDPKNAKEQARVGRDYLKAMLDRYQDLDHALAAYNWGPENVDKWVARGSKRSELPRETRNYIKRVRKQLSRDKK